MSKSSDRISGVVIIDTGKTTLKIDSPSTKPMVLYNVLTACQGTIAKDYLQPRLETLLPEGASNAKTLKSVIESQMHHCRCGKSFGSTNAYNGHKASCESDQDE